MEKTRLIRTKNTLVAAAGALLLTLELCFAHLMGGLTVSGPTLIAILFVFWPINLLIIYIVASGFSERFSDPSLSLFQMYWAMGCCLLSLLLMPRYSHLIFLLVFVVTIFGVFRLRPIQFVYFSLIQCLLLAVLLLKLFTLGLVNGSAADLAATWFVYFSCVMILNIICRSTAALRAQLKARNQMLQSALTARSQFLANMSHELRTPMNGVLGMLELLDTPSLNHEQKRYLGIARSSGESLLSVINDILDYSKIDAGKLELDRVEFDFRRAMDEFVQAFFLMAREKGLTLVLDVEPSVPKTLLADKARIRQIFNNIVGNAIKFTNEGEIVITLRSGQKNGSRVELFMNVRDTGCGISEEAKTLIFESFSQADNTTTRAFGGTGLGLAISRRLCHAMDGDICVSSEKEQGSTFSLSFWCDEVVDEGEPDQPLSDTRAIIIDVHEQRVEALSGMITYLGGSSNTLIAANIEPATLLQATSELAADTVIFHADVVAASSADVFDDLRRSPHFQPINLVVYAPSNDGVFYDLASHHRNLACLPEPASHQSLISVLGGNRVELADVADSDAASSKISPDSASPEPLNARGLALLVEDNAVNQEVAMMLLEDCDLEIDIASDGVQALECLNNSANSYHLIFMDCQMPNMDGYEATRAVRAGKAGAAYIDIPIIAMTANALDGDREKCLDAGMDDYITKPISFDFIEAAVKKWLPLNHASNNP